MIAILISTFDRYEKLAKWTATRIDAAWKEHPPIFFSGLTQHDDRSLTFEGNSQDWMNTNLQAVLQLREKGFTHAYLILDDHPPVGECHAGFLNVGLPELAIRLRAAYIGLLGYGQHRNSEGQILGPTENFLEHTAPTYRWKFSLHPGLWNLEDLQTLLECRMEIYPAEQRTPWHFERHHDVPCDPRLRALATRCFRVCGASSFSAGWAGHKILAIEAAHRLLIDIGLFIVKVIGGQPARDSAELRWLWIFGHYLGPYPMFWSGCMRQGKPHADFEKWLASTRSTELNWSAVKADCFLE